MHMDQTESSAVLVEVLSVSSVSFVDTRVFVSGFVPASSCEKPIRMVQLGSIHVCNMYGTHYARCMRMLR